MTSPLIPVSTQYRAQSKCPDRLIWWSKYLSGNVCRQWNDHKFWKSTSENQTSSLVKQLIVHISNFLTLTSNRRNIVLKEWFPKSIWFLFLAWIYNYPSMAPWELSSKYTKRENGKHPKLFSIHDATFTLPSCLTLGWHFHQCKIFSSFILFSFLYTNKDTICCICTNE